MQALIDTLKSYFNDFIQFWDDFAQSLKDIITDLPATLLKWATDFIQQFLDWAGSYCSYCLGGTTLSGGGSAVSVFAQKIEDALNSLSPCVMYAINMSGLQGDFQILACAMVVWSAFRVAGLIKSVI